MYFWTANLFVNLQRSLHLSVSMPLSLPCSSCLSYLDHSDTWYPRALTNPRPQLGHRGTICTHLLALRSRHTEAFWVALAGPRHLFFSFKPLSCVPVVSWMKTFCSVVPLAFFWFSTSVKEREHSAWFGNNSLANSLQLMFSVIVECFLDLLLRFKIVWFLVIG